MWSSIIHDNLFNESQNYRIDDLWIQYFTDYTGRILFKSPKSQQSILDHLIYLLIQY